MMQPGYTFAQVGHFNVYATFDAGGAITSFRYTIETLLGGISVLNQRLQLRKPFPVLWIDLKLGGVVRRRVMLHSCVAIIGVPSDPFIGIALAEHNDGPDADLYTVGAAINEGGPGNPPAGEYGIAVNFGIIDL